MVKGSAGHSHKSIVKSPLRVHVPRVATPPYCSTLLYNQIDKFIKKSGAAKAICLGSYNHMSVSSAAHGAGIVQNSQLIKALLQVSSYALFKNIDIQRSLVVASKTYDQLVPDGYKFNVTGWASLKSERIMVLMNHLRRLRNSATRLRQACSRLDDESKKELQDLVSRVQEYSEVSSKPSLLELPGLEDEMLDAEVLASKPMPPSKKTSPKDTDAAECLDVAELTPAKAKAIAKAVTPAKVKAAAKAVIPAKVKAAAKAVIPTAAAKDIKFFSTLAKQQSYIQYKVGGEKKKLLIAVSAKQSAKHHNVVKVMFDHINKNPTLDLSVVQSLRAALIG